jgi:hypothetical protein
MEPVITPSKRYYEKNKEAILAREKERKRWVDYYSRNKDVIRERNLQRYYDKAGRSRPEPKTPVPPPDNSKMEKLEALVAELRELVPHVMKTKKKKATPAPENEIVLEMEDVVAPA